MFHQSDVVTVQGQAGAAFYFRPTSRFVARRLVVGVVGRRWENLLVTDIRIAGLPQLPAEDPIPANVFDRHGEMSFSPCETNEEMTVHVWNKDGKLKRVFIRWEDQEEF